MSYDDDLRVSCKCGKVTLTKEDGYITSDFVDTIHLGQLAEEGCRRKRLRKWAWFSLLTMVVCAGLAYGTGLWMGEQRKMSIAKAEEWSWKAERHMKAEDYASAVEAYTQAIRFHPTVRSYLSRAFAYDELGQLEQAVEDCRRAFALDPKSDAASRTLARIEARLAEGQK